MFTPCSSSAQVLHDLGMTPTQALMRIPLPPKYLPVMLDGVVLGYLPSVTIPAVVTRLRNIKAAKLAEEETGPPDAKTMRLTVSTETTSWHAALAQASVARATVLALLQACNCVDNWHQDYLAWGHQRLMTS